MIEQTVVVYDTDGRYHVYMRIVRQLYFTSMILYYLYQVLLLLFSYTTVDLS